MTWTETLSCIAVVLEHDPDPPETAVQAVLELAALAATQLFIPRRGPVLLEVSLAALRIDAAQRALNEQRPSATPTTPPASACVDEDPAAVRAALTDLLGAIARAIARHLAQRQSPNAHRLAAAAEHVREAERHLTDPAQLPFEGEQAWS